MRNELNDKRYFLILIFAIFFSCESRELDKDQLQTFHNQYISAEKIPKTEKITDSIHCAWAFSQHLKPAQVAHSLWLEEIMNILVEKPQNRFSQLGSQGFEAFERQVLSKKIDSNRFEIDTSQNLQQWIGQVVQNQGISILITDFRLRTSREYKAIRIKGDTVMTNVNPYAWAAADLEIFWGKGGKLRIYPIPCAAQQKFFVLVFVPPMPLEKEKKLLAKFLKPENKLNVRLSPILVAQPQKQTLVQKFENTDQGALNEKLVAINYLQSADYEYFMLHKNDLADHYAQKRRLLFGNLFLPLDTFFLKKPHLETAVWDIGKNYQFFLQSLEAQSKNEEIDPETGDLRPRTSEVGFRFTGEIRAKMVFETILDSATNEIKIFGKKELLETEKESLFLVQIKLANSKIEISDTLRKLFRYPDPEGFWQEALYESLRKSLEKSLQNHPKETLFQFYWHQVD